MPRFEFRLKTLLVVREAARDGARTQLADALAELETLDARRARLDGELHEQKQWVRQGAAPGRIDARRLAAAHRYELVLGREINSLAEQQQALAAEIERRRQALVEADRDVRVLEKLRERQLSEFRQQQARGDVKELDEVAGRSRLKAEG